jgi:hypothetical protein
MKMNKLKTLFAKNAEYISINLMRSDYSTDLLKLFVFADFAKEHSIPKALQDNTIKLMTELETIEEVKELLISLDLNKKDLIEYIN